MGALEKGLYHGAAYYPELWPEEVMLEDIKYMKKAGINVVRMGEFAWADMEPEQDHISLDFFAGVIQRLSQEGIGTIMCTPTVTPPIWLTHGHPERMYKDQNLHAMIHGTREHVCVNNPFYRERSRIIVEAIARAMKKNPGVVGWQLHNEFNWPISECFCDSCKQQWPQWLAARYGTIQKLNEAWGTGVWSQRYQSFEQVPQPIPHYGPAPALHNASLSTAYRTFTRAKVTEYMNEQVEILRRFSDAPITTNVNRLFFLDNEEMFKELDFASFDDYSGSDNYKEILLNYDLWRNAKKGKPFWFMETSNSFAGGLRGFAPLHPQGYVKAEAAAAYALGSQAFCYWLWRQQRAGSEITHPGVLSSWGEPTFGFNNVLEVDNARRDLEPWVTESIPVQAEVAITYSDRARSYFLTENLGEVDYHRDILLWYELVLNTGIYRDVIFEGGSLKGYKLLMTPYLPYVSDEFLQKARSFMEKGGIWIAGPLTGYRDEHHAVHTGCALGELEKLSEVHVKYQLPLTGTGTKGEAFGVVSEMGLYSSLFEARVPEADGLITEGPAKGLAFITESRIGKGKLVMLGSMPAGQEGRCLLDAMVRHYAAEAEVSLGYHVTPGTVVAPRDKGGEILLIAVNMDGKGGRLSVGRPVKDLLTARSYTDGIVEIAPYGYVVLA